MRTRSHRLTRRVDRMHCAVSALSCDWGVAATGRVLRAPFVERKESRGGRTNSSLASRARVDGLAVGCTPLMSPQRWWSCHSSGTVRPVPSVCCTRAGHLRRWRPSPVVVVVVSPSLLLKVDSCRVFHSAASCPASPRVSVVVWSRVPSVVCVARRRRVVG